MTKRTAEEVFQTIDRRTEAIERLMDTLLNPPSGQQRDIISRIAVEGRSVTHLIQNLKGKVDGFETWYQPQVAEMSNDELLQFFYRLRTDTLKRGDDHVRGVQFETQPGVSIQLGPDGITTSMLTKDGQRITLHFPRPANATGTFLGDSEGGTGFIVEVDGIEKKQYVAVPNQAIGVTVLFQDPPTTHMGENLVDTTPVALCSLYVSYLRRLVESARQEFMS